MAFTPLWALKPGQGEPFEDARLFVELVLVQIMPDVIGLKTIAVQACRKTVEVEDHGGDLQRARLPGPGGIGVFFAGKIGRLGLASFAQHERGQKTAIAGAPGTNGGRRVQNPPRRPPTTGSSKRIGQGK